MRAVTTIGTQNANELNTVPTKFLSELCEEFNLKLTIIAGQITDGSITHRDYVWKTDGRNSYI